MSQNWPAVQFGQLFLQGQYAVAAYASGGQANATQLYGSLAVVATASAAGASVKLPPCRGPRFFALTNAGANAVQVFSNETSGVTIGGVAGSTGVSLAVNETAMFLGNGTDTGWGVVNATESETFSSLTVTGLSTLEGGVAGSTSGAAAAAGTVGELVYGVVQQSVASPITITYGTSPNVNCTNTFSALVPQPVTLATTGALPTGFSTTTVYYTIPSTISGSVIQLASSVADALAGTAISFSGGSGTQTLIPGCLTASGTLINVTGLPLSAGDWDVWGQVAYYDPATGTETVINAALSTTTGSLPGVGQVINGSQVTIVNASTTELGNTISDVPIPMCCVDTATAETVYMMTSVTEATETTTAYGFVAARRRR